MIGLPLVLLVTQRARPMVFHLLVDLTCFCKCNWSVAWAIEDPGTPHVTVMGLAWLGLTYTSRTNTGLSGHQPRAVSENGQTWVQSIETHTLWLLFCWIFII